MFHLIWLTDLHHALNSAVCVWLAEFQYHVPEYAGFVQKMIDFTAGINV